MVKKARSVMMRVDEDFAKKVHKIVKSLNNRDAARINSGKTRPYKNVEVTGWIAEDIQLEEYIR